MIVLILLIIVWYGYGLVQRLVEFGTLIAAPDNTGRFTLTDGPGERTGFMKGLFFIAGYPPGFAICATIDDHLSVRVI